MSIAMMNGWTRDLRHCWRYYRKCRIERVNVPGCGGWVCVDWLGFAVFFCW
jgi:hypothetical protein